jgi:DNA invertase Pin-like site-specific DNA recombinase
MLQNFGIFALMGEIERDLLRQRTRAGLAAARKRGRVGGRSKRITAPDLQRLRSRERSGVRRVLSGPSSACGPFRKTGLGGRRARPCGSRCEKGDHTRVASDIASLSQVSGHGKSSV